MVRGQEMEAVLGDAGRFAGLGDGHRIGFGPASRNLAKGRRRQGGVQRKRASTCTRKNRWEGASVRPRLTTFFGPAKRIVSFSDVLFPDKGDLTGCRTSDFAVGCIEFVSGAVARITCSIHTKRDHSLRIFGDDGVLTAQDCWDYGAPVLNPRVPKSWRERHPRQARMLGMGRPSVPLVRPSNFICYTDYAHRMDFCRGMAELAGCGGGKPATPSICAVAPAHDGTRHRHKRWRWPTRTSYDLRAGSSNAMGLLTGASAVFVPADCGCRKAGVHGEMPSCKEASGRANGRGR
jgi:hypothetical protein